MKYWLRKKYRYAYQNSFINSKFSMISFDKFQKTITDSRKSGMNKYKDIMSQFHDDINIATSREFQKHFNGFYRIRRNIYN